MRVFWQILHRMRPVLAVLVGLAAGLAVTRLAGESPWQVARILYHSAFGSAYDLGMTLFYATPLIFTGLSVSIAFHAGLFNIGAEGQLTLGALAMAAVGTMFPATAWPWAPWLAGLAGFAVGGLWGAIPGWLRARRGSHEVINTIMLNFVAAGLANWAIVYWLRNPDTQNPESKVIGDGFRIAHLEMFGDAPVSSALLIAVGVAGLVSWFLYRTVRGYELRAVGANEEAARAAGINAGRVRILAMTLAGGLAGLVGLGEVLGSAGKFKLGFSPDYGFIGIAVALLGRNRPLGVVLAALLFGALHKGSMDLDLETDNVTRDLSLILQALVILSVSADGLWDWTSRVGRAKKERKP